MTKINILVVPADLHAVGNFRFIEPHLEIQKKYPDDFYIDINPTPDWEDKNYLAKFQVIVGSHLMFPLEEMEAKIKAFQSQGTKIVIDFDDYWNLNQQHMLFNHFKERKNEEIALKAMSLADLITTTTPFLADEIAKYNKNVAIFPNAIDPTSKRFEVKPEESERVRIGYMGGSTHINDLELTRGMFASNIEKYSTKIQNVLCGFDMSAVVTDTDNLGRFFRRKIKPHENVWSKYEEIFTNNFKNLPKEYVNWLKTYKQMDYPEGKDMLYRRIWSKPISMYASNYNALDITLAPLENIRFTSFKSQLKVIESGFYKKAIMCSDVKPFQLDVVHGKNGLLVNDKSSKGWSYHIKNLIENADYRLELGEALYDTVKDKYDLRNVSKSRAEFYKTIFS